MRLTRSFLLPLLVASLVVLLALLGILQYRWTGEVSEAERARLREGAAARAQQLAQEFDGELTKAMLWLLVDRDSLDPGGAERYAERYERWVQRAPDPGLVKAIYRVESGEAGVRLFHFDPPRRAFESVEWPEDLLPFRESVGRPRQPGFGFSGPHEWILDEVPALVLPVPRFEARSARPPSGPGTPGPPRPTDWTVLVLDREVITAQILPRLGSRHLSTEGRVDYTFVVTRTADPKTIVYRSPGADVAASGDAKSGLLALRMEDATEEDLAAALPVWFGRPGATGRDRPRPASGGRRGFRSAEGAGRWTATITHRLGSVDAVVAAARRRNLAASFGILALLGTSAALLAVSAARARSLARRQMEFVAGVSHELRTPIAVLCSAGRTSPTEWSKVWSPRVATAPSCATRPGVSAPWSSRSSTSPAAIRAGEAIVRTPWRSSLSWTPLSRPPGSPWTSKVSAWSGRWRRGFRLWSGTVPPSRARCATWSRTQ